MHKWGLAPSPNCECGASKQTVDHVLTACPIQRAPHGARFWMMKLDAGLITLLPASDSGSAAVWGSKKINPRPQSCLCLTWSGCPSNDDDDDDETLHWRRGKDLEKKMELYKFHLSTFDCVSNGVGTRWIKWKRAFEIYANARKISDQKQKCSMLFNCGGMQLLSCSLQKEYFLLLSKNRKIEFN